MSASGATYVAIITDGNGRWAKQRGLPVEDGHRAGADAVKARLRDAVDLGIRELTVYSFSTENWNRPQAEVDGLMAMFARRIDRETPELDEEGVRMRFIGRRDRLGAELIRRMDWAERTTAGNERITLFVAFNYGGRAEIVDAARTFQGETEEEFRRHLYAPEMHERVKQRQELASALERGLERGEIEVHYQPIIALESGAVYGLEARARWRHPDLGLLSPAVFIPLAEERGLSAALTRQVLADACTRAAVWRSTFGDIVVLVNIALMVWIAVKRTCCSGL